MEQSWKTLFLLTFFCTFGLMTSAKAQITPDNSLGAETSTVGQPNQAINDIPINQIDQINGGARRGENLFHSFGEFNVNAGRAAYFSNPDGVGNILTRVTGVNRSNILGTLGVLGNANLFLINPNGIFFGPNSSLDVRGSFLGSSANSLLFDNGFEFSATNPQAPPLLQVNIPVGLRFRDNPGEIRVQGQGNNLSFDSEDFTFTRGLTPPGLVVQAGKTLALVGGSVNLEGGNLIADGGRIEVGSVAGSSVVSLTPIDKGWQLGYENVSSLGDIFLSGKASIDTSSNAGAGDIQVQGRNVKLTDGSGIFAFTGSEAGGTVSVNASDTLEVIGTGVSEKGLVPSTLYTAVSQNGNGTGGNLILRTRQFIQRGGSQVGSDTYGVGTAGNTIVNASESVTLNGISDNGAISTALGTVVQGTASGNGARLTVETKRLRVEDGALLVTFTFSQGNAASLVLKASESTDVIGSNSAISSRAFGDTTANGGAINLETGKLIIRDGAEITASSEGTGNAGDINVKSRSIFLDNQGGINATAKSGNGGNIYLNVQDYLRMRGNSEISTSAGGDGNGGNIFINNLPNYRGFVIAVPSENNDITANASQGRGGNITINSPRIFGLVERSLADLERLGVPDLNPINLSTSDITAFSQQPQLNGTISIQPPEVDPSRGLVELPETVTDTKQKIAQSPCRQGIGNEFVVTGRGGLPTSPNQALSSNNVRVDLLQPVASSGNSPSATIKPATTVTARRVPAQGWIFNDKGQVVLTAYDPTNTGSQHPFSTAAACPAR
ncbi:filamentous hemagglutinin N-terminal domain-containing protein [Scytonema hofmannii FACHB-248]|uniref:Filamentous hemagglutinin N-terminal domain-containing protein n=1 Tax=Scytonema hofmannii FACHB-248 TaxID=1842502 RepID=A0ABR8GUE9_9CYAN|nr:MULTISPECIES: filamentous hemagglutinin N-terminal domain-containing protein [Nostocales]MBD2606676.1 filamentous hemagglutinin N-terminal domain-containing protein [Scytonema hofmannii FACHB-248]